VVPEARRNGLGRALLLQFMDVARQLGAEQVFLEVRVGNAGAIALYEGSGFKAVARRVEYYPPDRRGGAREDALVMRCDLRRSPA
jgi:ribosomal protein S18 acetylase RimI-like enzyme